jgi:arginyl-tRNA synthetase
MATDTKSKIGQTGDPAAILDAALRRAIAAVLGDEHAGADPLVRPSQKPEFGDFQANGVMALAKQVKMNPRQLAEQIVAAADLGAIAEPPEVAGPGFINIRLKPEALPDLLEMMDDEALGVTPSDDAHPVVIDMCSVNVAKQMHVGHLRSSIIGDALARVFERLGRKVYRENHLGDWGVPIAMVLRELRQAGRDLDTLDLPDLDKAYREAQFAAKGDERGLAAAKRLGAGPHRFIELEEQNAGAAEAMEAAKTMLVQLQQGDEELVRDWHRLIDCTLRAMYEAMDILDVKLGPENNRGESFYRDRLADVTDAFVKSGLAKEDEGALIVPFEDRDRPMLIRKSDGGYLYATTDLAAVRFRAQELGSDLVVYVVDARQRDHFRDLFDAAHLIGWDRTADGTPVKLIHIAFGSVLGPDRRPLKTRSGENVTLKSLLDEACERGAEAVRMRAADPNAPTHGRPEAELNETGRAVGIGAIKYADLSSDLLRDYVFDMNRMIAFEGDTGPYLQYAHARICSIFARAGIEPAAVADAPFVVTDPAEKALVLALLQYGGAVADVAQYLEPHRLCQYLYDLANAYSAFYQNCPVLKAPDEAIRNSRLRLCDLVRRVLADGLNLLGIEGPRRM